MSKLIESPYIYSLSLSLFAIDNSSQRATALFNPLFLYMYTYTRIHVKLIDFSSDICSNTQKAMVLNVHTSVMSFLHYHVCIYSHHTRKATVLTVDVIHEISYESCVSVYVSQNRSYITTTFLSLTYG